MAKNKHYIYEIFGKKIGVTNDVVRRMKEQNVKEGEYRIIEEHTNAKVASEREITLQKEHNYPVDKIQYWKTLKMQKKAVTKEANEKRIKTTKVTHKDRKFPSSAHTPEARAKAIANTNYKLKTLNTDFKIIAEKRKKLINQYDLQGNFIKQWDSAQTIGLFLGKQGSAITTCCKGKLKTAYKFKWKYAN